MKEKTHLVRNRCLFSIVIIVIYFICHRIPLNGIDLSAYDNLGLDLGAVLSLAVNGSNKQCYVMSLGISPYITASLVISILFAMRSKEARARTSPKAMNYWITALTFIVTLIQSVFYALNLKYVDRNVMSVLLVIFELMAGASIAQYLLMKNKKYGVGGFAPIIMVNMTETLVGTLMKSSIDALRIPLGISFVMVVIMIFMEMHEKKIPLQRVSVHNVHADKNYLAIKYNPVGFMALMFGSAIFMIPQLVVALIHHYHKSEIVIFLYKNLNMSTVFGMRVYVVMLFLFTVLLSLLFVNPKDLSDDLLQGGDCIENIPAGKPTRRYIRKWVLFFSCLSGLIMCGCLSLCMYLQYKGIVDASVAMLPTTFMLLSGFICSIYLEIRAYRDFDSYKPFI
jgi:preprotein translocase subunit SecY